MYEFSKKEIRKKFKETKYGVKTSCWLYMSLIIATFSVIVCGTLCILSSGINIDLTEVSKILLIVLKTITFISVVCMCYFDGKRDGAIQQFKTTLKKEKK